RPTPLLKPPEAPSGSVRSGAHYSDLSDLGKLFFFRAFCFKNFFLKPRIQQGFRLRWRAL
ncbi:hypothetical protein, partial [Microbulbifer thermotolerans]|uniref:hypothetical protein n=1 Tax=Microbulbifer thermotolerans TaxID=252514 RepID=UPI00224937A4